MCRPDARALRVGDRETPAFTGLGVVRRVPHRQPLPARTITIGSARHEPRNSPGVTASVDASVSAARADLARDLLALEETRDPHEPASHSGGSNHGAVSRIAADQAHGDREVAHASCCR